MQGWQHAIGRGRQFQVGARLRCRARFATRGDPNGQDLPRWPRYDSSTDPYLELGTAVRAGAGYRRAQLDALAPFFAADQP